MIRSQFLKLKNFDWKRYSPLICFLLSLILFYYFFSYSMTITFDGGHYMSYVSILRGESPWETWDIVRGPVFPFLIYVSNIIFGKTSIGLLMFSFLWYLLMLFVLFLSLKEVLGLKGIGNKVFIFVIILFAIINPIVFGYYHALLTEYVAITLAIVGCYLSFKYLNTDIFRNTRKFVLYSVVITILIIFSWFLKQPYISVTLFPFLIANLLSIIDERSIKNFLARLFSFFSCIIILFLSLFLWNYFLSSKGIDLKTNRNITMGLGSQLIRAVDFFQIMEEEIYIEDSTKNQLERGRDEGYKVVKIYDNNKKLDTKVVKSSNNVIPLSSSIEFLTEVLFERPKLIIGSYIANYLAIINIYGTYTPDGIGYYVKRGWDWSFENENSTIARRIFNNSDNIFYMPDESLEKVLHFKQINNPPLLLNKLMSVLSVPFSYLFKISFLILPLTLLGSVVYKIYILIKKQRNDIINLIIIFLGFSFMHLLLHTITGALIDRYAAPAIIPTITGHALVLYILYTQIFQKKRYEKTKS